MNVTGKLGSGRSGVVYSVSIPALHEKMALKVVTLKGRITKDKINEIQIVSSIYRSKINRDALSLPLFYNIIHSGGATYLLLLQKQMETSLDKVFASLRTRDALLAIQRITEGLEKLHSARICHMDVKLDNVLVSFSSGSPDFRLFDFGISAPRGGAWPPTTQEVDPSLFSPGMKIHHSLRTTASPDYDLWRLGIVSYQLLTKSRYVDDLVSVVETQSEDLSKFLHRKLSPVLQGEKLSKMVTFIASLLDLDLNLNLNPTRS